MKLLNKFTLPWIIAYHYPLKKNFTFIKVTFTLPKIKETALNKQINKQKHVLRGTVAKNRTVPKIDLIRYDFFSNYFFLKEQLLISLNIKFH